MDEILRLKSDRQESILLSNKRRMHKENVTCMYNRVFKLLSLPYSCTSHHILAIKYKIMSFVIT